MAEILPFERRMLPRKTASDSTPDAAAREAALDIRQSAIVEAPAGSGKTGLLIQRFLKLLADPGVTDPAQVLAITFTRKATGELHDRISTQLRNASTRAPVNDRFEREIRSLAEAVLGASALHGWDLLAHPERLRIRTIDSVCSEIARSLPVLSGAGGQLTPTEDSATLRREAAHRTMMLLGGADPLLNDALRTLLLHRDGNLADCEKLIAEMLATRDQWGSLIPLAGDDLTDEALDRNVLPRLEAALDRAICAGLQQLASTIPADVLDALTFLASEMGHAAGYKGGASPIALCAGLNAAPGETADHLAHWRALIHLLTTAGGTWRATTARNHLGFEIEKWHAPRLAEILDSLRHRDDLLTAFDKVCCLPPARYPQEQWHVTRALFRILRSALIELQFIFSAKGECDFPEVGLLARTALRRDAHGNDLAAALGMRLQHLLVDEVQDTSTSQYELIEQLTHGWDGHSQTVFLVGDPKQSIYLFREARVERFLYTMRHGRLGDLPLQTLRLTANFRTQASLVAEVNHDFARILPSASTATAPEDVAFIAAEPTREATETAGRVWHTALVDPTPEARTAQMHQRRRDAAEVRRIVDHWQARPLPADRTKPWSMAILVQSRSHVREIVEALKADPAIPFRAINIDSLAERPEVLDLFALTRALLHPADRIAWFAILRAPWCGLTLADLHLLAGADDRDHADTTVQQLIAHRGDLLSSDGCSRLERLWTVLEAAGHQRARLPLSQWVERCWRSLGADLWLDTESIRNTHRFFQLLDELEEDTGTVDIPRLEVRLKKLYAETSQGPAALDITTIHSSKGLEWDIVIVPAMERGTAPNKHDLLAFAEVPSTGPLDDSASHVVLAPIAGRGEDSKELNDWIRSLTTAREASERKRLLYVACTRAREELHLFASPARKKEGKPSLPLNSLLKTAWPAAEAFFDQIGAAPSATNLIELPGPRLLQSAVLDSLAAATASTLPLEDEFAEAPPAHPPPRLHRLPADFSVAAHFRSYVPLARGTSAIEASSAASPFTRPEGSFAARALGSTIHALLDLAATRVAAGDTCAALVKNLPSWQPRIAALLRSHGLPPAAVERLTATVASALANTLADPIGQWILTPHPGAASEQSLATAENTLRLDRTFRAGPEPIAAGSTHLWIVDFKTTAHGPGALDAFLKAEREKYTPQMRSYAALFTPGEPNLRTLLYYPLIPAHTWWTPDLTP